MPTLAQIPQSNIQVNNVIPDFSGIVNSYQGYVNHIIQKDKENKTVFEQAQQQFDNIQIGNGSQGDKQVYSEINRKYGQKIHELSNSANGLNGYADLTKQVEALQHDIVRDSGIQALQTSFIQKQQRIQNVLGKTSTDVVMPNGNKVTKEVDNYKDYTVEEKQIELQRVERTAGVKPVLDENGIQTGEYRYEGGDIDLPNTFSNKFIKTRFSIL